jgi:hypothetical protein
MPGVMRDYQASQRLACGLICVEPKTVRQERQAALVAGKQNVGKSAPVGQPEYQTGRPWLRPRDQRAEGHAQ